MKANKWTIALASAGVIGGFNTQADESPVMTALASTTISGYVDVSAHWNLDEQGTRYARPANYQKGYSRKDDGFNLNVVNLQIAKPLDEGQWAAGYNVELLFGPDAAGYNTSVSDGYSGNISNSDIGIKQAYVNFRTPVGNGLDFKFGVFDTPIGYEVFNNGSNPNYTRSWGWFVQPTQHTGVLASYEFNDVISATAGVANTHASGINSRAHPNGNFSYNPKSEADKTVLGSIAITAPESAGFLQGSTLYGGAVYGFSSSTGDNQANYYAGATMSTPVEGLSAGLAYDYVHQNGTFFDGPNHYQNVFGVYVSYQVTEKVSVHGRGEYANGDAIYTDNNGKPGEIWSGTATLQYDLWKNVLTRLEFRFDQANDGMDTFGWNDDNQYLIALNAIYKF